MLSSPSRGVGTMVVVVVDGGEVLLLAVVGEPVVVFVLVLVLGVGVVLSVGP